jgi:hypothetical protein
MFLTLPFMAAIQIISACIGWQTRKGLAANIALRLPLSVLYGLVALLVVANTINIAADLAAMGEALRLVVGGPALLYALAFGLACLVAEVLVPYHRYAGYLKFLTLVLFVYVAAAFTVQVPWGKVFASTFIPKVSFERDFLLMIVAVFGTTISPYLFFWQASQEAEESRLSHRRQYGLKRQPGKDYFRRISIDTWTGMLVSNVIAGGSFWATRELGAASQSRAWLLCHRRRSDARRGCTRRDEDRSDRHAVLDRGHQRRCRRAHHDCDDARGLRTQRATVLVPAAMAHAAGMACGSANGPDRGAVRLVESYIRNWIDSDARERDPVHVRLLDWRDRDVDELRKTRSQYFDLDAVLLRVPKPAAALDNPALPQRFLELPVSLKVIVVVIDHVGEGRTPPNEAAQLRRPRRNASVC